MSATRNLGIKYTRGEYVGFLDADDIWLPDKLAAQVAIFNEYPQCKMVYGKTQIWYSWIWNPEDQKKDHFFPLGVKPNTVIAPPKIALLILENKVQSPTTCNVLIKKTVFEKVGLFLENFKGMFEDAAFFCKAALFISIYVSDSFWAKYRQHGESCSSIAAKTNTDEQARYNFLQWFKGYLDSKKIYSAKIRVILFREMFSYRYKFLYNLLAHPRQLSKRFLSYIFRQIKNQGINRGNG
jgi:glycosyltransferase involved in cell wall biosynthesis